MGRVSHASLFREMIPYIDSGRKKKFIQEPETIKKITIPSCGAPESFRTALFHSTPYCLSTVVVIIQQHQ